MGGEGSSRDLLAVGQIVHFVRYAAQIIRHRTRGPQMVGMDEIRLRGELHHVLPSHIRIAFDARAALVHFHEHVSVFVIKVMDLLSAGGDFHDAPTVGIVNIRRHAAIVHTDEPILGVKLSGVRALIHIAVGVVKDAADKHLRSKQAFSFGRIYLFSY